MELAMSLYLLSRKCFSILARHVKLSKILNNSQAYKIYYGCGNIAQPGYINIDVRWTPAVDLIGDLDWCRKIFRGLCSELYLSHVLEHYAYPGRAMRAKKGTVLDALQCTFDVLSPGGVIRIAVPDFEKLCTLYSDGMLPLYPRISGRLCGEQDYKENLHKCVFDKKFLEHCLINSGFVQVNSWDPETSGLILDSSFDSLEGITTSLNLVAQKPN